MTGYEELRDSVAVVDLERDVVAVRGPDAPSYLQGQLSQDVEALANGESALSLILEPQGRVDALVRVTRKGPDEYVLDVDAGSGSDVIARLRRFKLRTKVEIEAVEGWRTVAVRGPHAPAATDESWDRNGIEVTAAFPWPGIGGVDLLGPAPVAPPGVATADAEAFEVRRIECGLPRIGRELDDRTIPEEAGVVGATVSFSKGCYTGQELVARIDSRGGNVPRRLRIVRSDAGSVLAIGTELLIEGQTAGVVTSVVPHPAGGQVGLGYVKRGFAGNDVAEAHGESGAVRVALLVPPSTP